MLWGWVRGLWSLLSPWCCWWITELCLLKTCHYISITRYAISCLAVRVSLQLGKILGKTSCWNKYSSLYWSRCSCYDSNGLRFVPLSWRRQGQSNGYNNWGGFSMHLELSRKQIYAGRLSRDAFFFSALPWNGCSTKLVSQCITEIIPS